MNRPDHTINKEMTQSENVLSFHTVSTRKTGTICVFNYVPEGIVISAETLVD